MPRRIGKSSKPSATGNFRWPPKMSLPQHGHRTIEENLKKVLLNAWKNGFTTKSEFARTNADYVAIAACMKLITTRILSPDVWGCQWQITSRGLFALEDCYGVNTDEDDEEEI